jgi:hypothetical protein
VLARTALVALILAAILSMTAACASADSSARSTQPSATTTVTVVVPPAWAGVWDVHEQFASACSADPPRSYRVTLCAGDMFQPFPAPFPDDQGWCAPQYAVFTDSTFEMHCSDYSICEYCCFPNAGTLVRKWDTKWSRSGDDVTTTTTFTSSLCGQTSCITMTGTRTRVWPESSICGSVPTRPLTWGHLKLLYR